MNEKIYQINEVEIKGITWNSFKYTIKTMELPEKEIPFSGKPLQFFNKEQLQNLIANATRTGIPFQLKSKEERSKERVRELLEQSTISHKARQKLIDLIDSFTDMNGEEINKFIKFCDLPRAFILNSTEYEIILVLEKKLIDYKKQTTC